MKEKEIIKKIQDYALEDIMGLRFGAYAKEIIQERAIPDARDGLKPVQRRILYDMHHNNNVYNKPYLKCAYTVGSVLGKWHPHGDASVYDAMIRMSQWWKQNHILIDVHGNNGSIDGDGAAAYRYTEARLSKISNELLNDIDKNTVAWSPNFDDRFLEPAVLPLNSPNFLVNGSSGISTGYATNIPPHNLGEIIDACIKRIDSPNCRLETILEIVKGPDFPTGGICMGHDGIVDAFTTGRGRVVLRCKYDIVKSKSKEQIVITEIPYDVNKSSLVQKIDSIRIDKKIDGILEVRDETDREGIRIVIDLKPKAKTNLIVNYLLKNTDMQTSFNYNMVAIVNRTPKTLGILDLLDAFINHKKEVVVKRTEFDLEVDEKKSHILEGFIKALDILDKVIKTIRSSKNKEEAINNLVKEYDFSKVQAEAIVMMQLYKLTNTDVNLFKEEYERLKEEIAFFKSILSDEGILFNVIKNELRSVKKEFAHDRKTVIEKDVDEIKINELDMVSKEDFVVCISKAGYVKKVSLKSYNLSSAEYPGVKENDYIEGFYKMNNHDTVLMFTNQGNYLYVPVREIPECKYKDLGSHISNIIQISDEESIVKTIAVNNFDNTIITAFTKMGMCKRMLLKDFEVSRYSKPMIMFKLKNKDELISISKSNEGENNDVYVFTKEGYALRYSSEEIAMVGLRGSGVKNIRLSNNDYVVSSFVTKDSLEYISIFTDNNMAKRIKLDEVKKTSRALKGSIIIKKMKSKVINLFKAFNVHSKTIFGILEDEIKYIKSSDIVISDKSSNGNVITKKNINDIFVISKLTIIGKEDINDEIKEEETDVKDEVPKERVVVNLTMSDFFEEFKI